MIQHYINAQIAERERERDERERERELISLVPESQRAALLLAREKTKQMNLERGRPTTSKSREGTSYLTIFIITIDIV